MEGPVIVENDAQAVSLMADSMAAELKWIVDRWIRSGVDPVLIFQVMVGTLGGFGAACVNTNRVTAQQVIDRLAEEAVYAAGGGEEEASDAESN